MLILVVAGLPSFIAETRFAGDAFTLFRWRSPDTRMQIYLESVIAREDNVKEVKLFGLAPLLLGRYRDIFKRLYGRDRDLAIRRMRMARSRSDRLRRDVSTLQPIRPSISRMPLAIAVSDGEISGCFVVQSELSKSAWPSGEPKQ